MTNIGWYLMNPHVQRVQKSEYVYSKGGRESLRLSYGRSKLTLISREKKFLRRCNENLAGRNFDFRAKSSRENFFMYIKKILSGGFCSSIKIVA